MSLANCKDFRSDYPGGYVEVGKVFDGSGKVIGYLTKDKVIRINDGSSKNGNLYRYDERQPKV